MPSKTALGGLTRPQAWVVALLVGVVALNTYAFVKIDELTVTQRTKALSRAATSDLMDLAASSTHSRTRFDLYVAMGDLYPDATVVLSETTYERREVYLPFFLSLGDAAEVLAPSETQEAPLGLTDDATAADVAIASGATVATGDGGSGGPPWRIVVAERDTGESTNERTFVVLERPIATSGSFDYEVLVVEVSLLETLTAVES